MTRDAPSAYVPPPAFGPFRVLHQVGVGALGPVFRTYEPTRDRLVAVKVFRLDIVPEQARALADALSRASEAGLFHPSIVEPIASGVEGSVAYRAEEYVAAESLDVAMRHYAPAAVEKTLPFVTQLAGAIDFARAAGIGHGGLHPRDIFITPDEARATGFGVVEALEQVGIRAPVRRPYSAPERVEGQPWGVAADVFALAAITFELLSGRQPAGPGRDAGALPDSPNRASLEAVLARAMDRDPARRYGTALAFAAALEAAARGEKVEEPAAASAAAVLPPEPATRIAAETPAAAVPPLAPESAPLVQPAPGPAHDDGIEPTLFDRRGETVVEDVDVSRRDHDQALEPTLPLAIPRSAEPEIAESVTLASDAHEHDDEGATLALHPPHAEPEPFTDEFLDEQGAVGEQRRPLEAEGEREPTRDRADTAFSAVDRAPSFGAVDEGTEGPGLASYIAVAVIGLVLGFGAAYFIWGRNSVPAPSAAENATTAPAPDASTPATSPDAKKNVSGASPDQAGTTKATVPDTAAPSPAPSRAEPVPSAGNENAATRAAAPAARRGQIVVRSTPSRAGVTVNGTWRGRTPLTLDSLPFGHYIVRVIQPDYKTAREEFALSTGNPSRSLNVRLESEKTTAPARPRPAPPSRSASAGRAAQAPVKFTGTLFVDSHPQGATVVIDGKAAGKTPLRLSDMPIGTHVVRLELARHRPWYSTARVVAGQEVRVAGSLEEIQ